MGWGCTVCGKATDKPRGYTRHPICCKCLKDPEQKGKWIEQLRQYHTDLYFLETGKVANYKLSPSERLMQRLLEYVVQQVKKIGDWW